MHTCMYNGSPMSGAYVHVKHCEQCGVPAGVHARVCDDAVRPSMRDAPSATSSGWVHPVSCWLFHTHPPHFARRYAWWYDALRPWVHYVPFFEYNNSDILQARS